mmetsp:Transcript_10242/g.23085  ORF Transcript_10242/g.23085 Transcript_10242/m.23085 type:complete len:202 (-) Transcript_10242:281-886(-)
MHATTASVPTGVPTPQKAWGAPESKHLKLESDLRVWSSIWRPAMVSASRSKEQSQVNECTPLRLSLPAGGSTKPEMIICSTPAGTASSAEAFRSCGGTSASGPRCSKLGDCTTSATAIFPSTPSVCNQGAPPHGCDYCPAELRTGPSTATLPPARPPGTWIRSSREPRRPPGTWFTSAQEPAQASTPVHVDSDGNEWEICD